MSKKKRFEDRYQAGDTPWELDRPDSHLIKVVSQANIEPGKALDIGCGTGWNAIWLAQNGFDVLGIDFSKKAIEKAYALTAREGVKCGFRVKDFLKTDIIADDFSFVFDRGCFHSFDGKSDRERFAQNVSRHLRPSGIWFSILGNADAAPRDDGPPTRSAADIIMAVEPWFEILQLTAGRFDSNREHPARCWLTLMKNRKK
jgi:SAM-dependent methyltransferase